MKKDSIKWYCFYHFHMNFESAAPKRESEREKRKMTLTQQNLALHTALKREKELRLYRVTIT